MHDAGLGVIVAQHLHRVYRRGPRSLGSQHEIAAVDGISLRVPTGTIFGLLGPDGAGKTTTIKMLSTLIERRLGPLPEVSGTGISRDEEGSTDLTVLSAEVGDTLERMLSLLRAYPASIAGVRVSEPSPEDVFLAVVGRSFE
jgi:ABC-type uncharacterized transport system ATPase subunit